MIKFVVIGSEQSKKACLKEAEQNPIRMGDHVLENSEKYPGYKINENATAASITETIESRLPAAIAKGNEIMSISEDPRLIGFPTAMGPISEYETKIIPKLLNNAEFWLGLNDSHIKTLQNFQDTFIMKVFQVSARGTPKGMLRLDSQMLSMK